MAETGTARGLAGVVVAESSICRIDGGEGELDYRGYSIASLAGQASFEEVAHLLWTGRLPDRAALAELKSALGRALRLPAGLLDQLRSMPRGALPMDVLRSAVSLYGAYQPAGVGADPDSQLRQAVELTGALATAIAAFERFRQQLPVPEPRPDLDHAGNFLWMLTGEVPERAQARTLDAALILHMEHGFNASTFAARVAASTLADMAGAVAAAVATLKGPLHGGANERVMAMLDEIASPEAARAWVRERLARREKIMGFGHRVYKTMDPRATVLRSMAEKLARDAGLEHLFAIAAVVEEEVGRALGGKGIAPNVDFFSALVYRALGIPTDTFTPVFALARVAGWTAHVLEQYADNRLIRPKARYVGPTGERFVPLGER